MRSYTEPAALLHLRGAWSLIWPLHASGGSTMASQSPYEASDHIFGLKHKLAFNQTAKDTSKRTIDDPHSSLNQLTKTLPQFEDSHESKANIIRSEIPNTQVLGEVHKSGPADPTACAEPSKLPQRHFCAMCGFRSPYTCNSCGARYCCVRCLGTQLETRYTTVS
uniref:HIT-type domain-containing protein n=1 Tax=Oncorhynchus tshawytscha TaxID=74940 RepID=A0A8C8JD45_ONCTS